MPLQCHLLICYVPQAEKETLSVSPHLTDQHPPKTKSPTFLDLIVRGRSRNVEDLVVVLSHNDDGYESVRICVKCEEEKRWKVSRLERVIWVLEGRNESEAS